MNSEQIIIVSDLHLSHSPSVSTQQEREGHGLAFAHFLEHLVQQMNVEGTFYRLLLLGDFLDFLVTETSATNVFDQTDKAALQRLDSLLEQHASIFDTLAFFLEAGSSVDIVPGNHDIDFFRPVIQSRLKSYLISRSNPDIADRIQFHPWIFYLPGILYAEHGHQYHDINAFSCILLPHRGLGWERIEKPLGAILDYYLLYIKNQHKSNQLCPNFTFFGTPLPSSLEKTILFFRTIPVFFGLLWSLLRQFVYRAGPKFRRLRQIYRQTTLHQFALDSGLSREVVAAIDLLSATSNSVLVKRLIGKLISRSDASGVRYGYLYKAAQHIKQILTSNQYPVPFLAFGHTHQPAKESLGESGTSVPAYYLNSGTWLPSTQSQGEKLIYPFIQIHVPTEGVPPKSYLMQWDDLERNFIKVR